MPRAAPVMTMTLPSMFILLSLEGAQTTNTAPTSRRQATSAACS
jgi:hypothetical protein